MTEAEWVESMARHLRRSLEKESVSIKTRLKLAYEHEITSYGPPEPQTRRAEFETDLAIVEPLNDGRWKPRVVVEAKIGTATTHDAITYSQKAEAHRSVHSYLRYGIMLGNREHYPLPGRLYRHGAQFDFMASFESFEPTEHEMNAFVDVLKLEILASRTLEKILYDSRRPDRDQYTILHRQLVLR